MVVKARLCCNLSLGLQIDYTYCNALVDGGEYTSIVQRISCVAKTLYRLISCDYIVAVLNP